MKWLTGIILLLSLTANVYFILDEVKHYQNREYSKLVNRALGGEFSKTTWKEGLDIFKNKLKEQKKDLLNKKYYYINVWTYWCVPCIKEMPWLDSIAGNLNNDVGYFFVSEMTDAVADKCLKNKNYKIKNFTFLNNMNNFVSAICNERGTKNKTYPMVLILNNKGQLLHYSIGAYGNAREASGLKEMIDHLE